VRPGGGPDVAFLSIFNPAEVDLAGHGAALADRLTGQVDAPWRVRRAALRRQRARCRGPALRRSWGDLAALRDGQRWSTGHRVKTWSNIRIVLLCHVGTFKIERVVFLATTGTRAGAGRPMLACWSMSRICRVGPAGM